jgi:transcriptional regulator with XRE-family HTH domain
MRKKKSHDMLKIGYNIKKLRELKNISRQYVADNVGLSLKTYANIENDVTSPDIKIVEKIAETIDVSVYKLFNFDEKVILNNNGKHVENFGTNFNQYGLAENERNLFEKLTAEKDQTIATQKELIQQLKNTIDGFKKKQV